MRRVRTRKGVEAVFVLAEGEGTDPQGTPARDPARPISAKRQEATETEDRVRP